MSQTPESPGLLTIDGAVESPRAFSPADLEAIPAEHQVTDVSRFPAGRKGDGVTLQSLLDLVRPRPEADYITLHATRDDFHVSIPLEPVRDQAVVVYKIGDLPLTPAQGGPIRFLIKDPAACHTHELDDCANVKFLDRIELSARKGRDTRPASESEHAALHARQS